MDTFWNIVQIIWLVLALIVGVSFILVLLLLTWIILLKLFGRD